MTANKQVDVHLISRRPNKKVVAFIIKTKTLAGRGRAGLDSFRWAECLMGINWIAQNRRIYSKPLPYIANNCSF